jgi:hypothetical protein
MLSNFSLSRCLQETGSAVPQNRPAAQRRFQTQTTYWKPVGMKRFFIRNRVAGGSEEPRYHDNRSAMFFSQHLAKLQFEPQHPYHEALRATIAG